jgi:hypothetical protein
VTDPRRTLVAQSAIALAVCLGGYIVFVDPPRQELVQERAKAAALASQVQQADSTRDQIPQITAALQAATGDAANLLELGRLARDERQLYAAVVATAEQHRVQIDQLNPAKMPAAPTRPGAQPDMTGVRDIALGYSISAAGAYSDITAFVHALQSELGFTMVRSISLASRGNQGEDNLRASIDTAHFFFDPTPAGPAPSQQVAGAPGGN